MSEQAISGALPLWRRQAEVGHTWIIRLLIQLSVLLGRRLTRPGIAVIALWYWALHPAARRASRNYWQHLTGSGALTGQIRQFLTFAYCTHDRIYMNRGHHHLFEVTFSAPEDFYLQLQKKRPMLLMGGHLGNFEVLGSLAAKTNTPYSMLMYLDNAAKFHHSLHHMARPPKPHIISLHQPDAMLRAAQDLREGRVLGMLADRQLSAQCCTAVSFLGAPAFFPNNPFRLARLCRCTTWFMAGLSRGGNRYELCLTPIADFGETDTPIPGAVDKRKNGRGQLSTMEAQALHTYVQLLEDHCRQAPENWFNFYDFWQAR